MVRSEERNRSGFGEAEGSIFGACNASLTANTCTQTAIRMGS